MYKISSRSIFEMMFTNALNIRGWQILFVISVVLSVYVGCRTNEFKCGDGYCIPDYKKCDGTFDCTDGSDERGDCGKFMSCLRSSRL